MARIDKSAKLGTFLSGQTGNTSAADHFAKLSEHFKKSPENAQKDLLLPLKPVTSKIPKPAPKPKTKKLTRKGIET